MPELVHALIEEEYLVKGVLWGPALPMVWDEESGWSEFPIPLSEITKAFTVRVLSATEAVQYMGSPGSSDSPAARSP
jgi:hypothetical protein